MKAKTINEGLKDVLKPKSPGNISDEIISQRSLENVSDNMYNSYDELEQFINDHILEGLFRHIRYPKMEDVKSILNLMTDEIIDTWEQTTEYDEDEFI